MESNQQKIDELKKLFGNAPGLQELVDAVRAKREAEKAAQQPAQGQ